MNLTINVKLLEHAVGIPRYAHPHDAGADLCATEQRTLKPLERTLMPTGVCLEIPAGFGGFVHPRSGTAARSGLSIVNAPGTIDAGYRGEICVNLINLDAEIPITLERGDRIAQLVIAPVVSATFHTVDELRTRSSRGTSGHGSTGIR